MIWKLADAKNKFSDAFNRAIAGEPQTISRRGKEVVVVSKRDYEKAATKKPKKTFIEHLLSIPKGGELELTRKNWRERDADFGPPRPSTAKPRKKTAAARRAKVLLSSPDSLIAATALHHGLAVMTRNVRYFENTGVTVIDPWEGRAA
jgi:antitoxin Phd